MDYNMNTFTFELLCHDSSLLYKYDNQKNFKSDSGHDLYIPEDVIFKPGETKLVDLKVSARLVEMGKEKECSYPYYLYARSSIYKTPLRLANSVGIIDRGYRGNLMAALDNRSNDLFELKAGTRLVQLCSFDLRPVNFKIVNSLDNTERGSGGFGSTGK